MRIEGTSAVQIPDGAALASVAYTKGVCSLNRRDVRQALGFFDTAQHHGYDITECAAARWDCWMLLGQFERAWQESDLIAESGSKSPGQFWDGSSWLGKHVMLRCLHGLGDTIQFIRYAPLLKRTCSYLSVQTHPQLVTLLQGVPDVDHVFTWDQPDRHWHMQMEVTELPRAFRSTASDLPSATPYIHIPENRIVWGAGFCRRANNLRIGISWQAGPWDAARSLPLTDVSRLATSHNHCTFYGLQKGANSDDRLSFANICDIEVHAADIRDTAALIVNLDLIITVDTMTAHLAGALGRPVWILLPFKADWRWMLNRTDSPWYPTARLFRQKRPGEWMAVIEEVRAALVEISQ